MSAFIQLTSKGLKRWRSGHPWIFRSDLSAIGASSAGGIEILAPDKTLLGYGLYSPLSQIAVRELTRDRSQADIGELIRRRIQAAYQMREKYFPDSNVYRLVFAEGDGLPSLIIDRYDQILVFQTLSAGMEIYKTELIETLIKLLKPQSIVERNDAPVRKKEGLLEIRQCVYGKDFKEIEIEFKGKKFLLNPLEGQKTGFFLDQRFNARQVATFAHGKLLDAFCNSGQFSIQAAPKIDKMMALDISENTLKLTEENFKLNQIKNYECLHANAFDFLKKEDEEKSYYDTIILDPPAFVKHRASLEAATRGYKEINLRALKLLNSEGILATFTCSQNISWDLFKDILNAAARDAKKRAQVLAYLQQPWDHPHLLNMPESEYLKGIILRVTG